MNSKDNESNQSSDSSKTIRPQGAHSIPELDISAVNDTTVLDTKDSSLPTSQKTKRAHESNLKQVSIFFAAASAVIALATVLAITFMGSGIKSYTFSQSGVEAGYPETWTTDDEGRLDQAIFTESAATSGEYKAHIGISVLSQEDIDALELNESLAPTNIGLLYDSIVGLSDAPLELRSTNSTNYGLASSTTTLGTSSFGLEDQNGTIIIHIIKLDKARYVSLYLRAHTSDLNYTRELTSIAESIKLTD